MTGYALLRGLVQNPLLANLYKYARRRPATLERIHTDSEERTPGDYGDPMMEMLLANLTPRIEAAAGLELDPTFAWFRVYQPGDALKRHLDRAACEIALTVNLGYQGGYPWPLWVEDAGRVSLVDLEPGDGLLYRGCQHHHWRHRFEGEHAALVFLFWVDRHGPHAEWKFDKRKRLSSFVRPAQA